MKRWYKSAFCKGMLILAVHISAIAAAICLLIAVAYPGQNYSDLFTSNDETSYEDTIGFGQAVQDDMSEVLDMIRTENALDADGNISLDKVIDFAEVSSLGENQATESPGEFSFKLGDLLKKGNSESQIVVCRKPEGELEYQYYTSRELAKLIKENEYYTPDEWKEETGGRENILREIAEGTYLPDIILDKEDNTVFSEIWEFPYLVENSIKTAEGKTMLELANTSENWNGKLAEMYRIFDEKHYRIVDEYENYKTQKENYREGNTNLSYLLVNYDKKMIRTNRREYQSIENVDESVRKMKESGKYIVAAQTLAECDTNLKAEQVSLSEAKHQIDAMDGNDKVVFVISVDTQYPIHDAYDIQGQAYYKYMPLMNQAVGIGIASAIVFFICLIWLTIIAGYSNQEEGVVLVFFDKWKTEIGLCFIAALVTAAVGIAALWVEEAMPWNWTSGLVDINMTAPIIIGTAAIVFAVCALFLSAYLSLVRRIKAKSLWKNSILRWLCQSIGHIFANRSIITKSLVVGVGLFFINLLIMTQQFILVFPVMCVDVFAVIIMAKRAIEKDRIKKGILRIAEGDSEYKIPLDNLKGDNRDIAEKVNHIGEGIQNAVEKSLKDERLKTDLITNVSHDIKTPLTSIINYVGLLKQEHFEDPKIQRYLDILDAKSQRLKTLTEDVVEASKISSGNINLEIVNLNLVEMIHQTTGEFAEKFENKNLKAVLNIPEESVVIRADGRRMWRVIENIYNNAAKYAMPGTRIYADMKVGKQNVQFSLKNVSEYPLNITADELTERFIRGDISRSTEGSGLGLSIAKNLTEMQGGQFDIYVDGDLFKVTITFPKVTTDGLENL